MLDTTQAVEKIRQAVATGAGFSFVRLGDGEAMICNAKPGHSTETVGPPLRHFELMAPAALRRTSMVGIQKRRDGDVATGNPFYLVHEMIDTGRWPLPELQCSADLWYDMEPTDVCAALELGDWSMGVESIDRRWLLVTSHPDTAITADTCDSLSIAHVIRVPAQRSGERYSEIMGAIRTALRTKEPPLTGVLFACGPVKMLLAPYVAQEFDIPAIDLGAIVDCWVGQDSRTISRERGLATKWRKLLEFRQNSKPQVVTPA